MPVVRAGCDCGSHDGDLIASFGPHLFLASPAAHSIDVVDPGRELDPLASAEFSIGRAAPEPPPPRLFDVT